MIFYYIRIFPKQKKNRKEIKKKNLETFKKIRRVLRSSWFKNWILTTVRKSIFRIMHNFKNKLDAQKFSKELEQLDRHKSNPFFKKIVILKLKYTFEIIGRKTLETDFLQKSHMLRSNLFSKKVGQLGT